MTEMEFLAGQHLDAKCEAGEFSAADASAIRKLMEMAQRNERERSIKFLDRPEAIAEIERLRKENEIEYRERGKMQSEINRLTEEKFHQENEIRALRTGLSQANKVLERLVGGYSVRFQLFSRSVHLEKFDQDIATNPNSSEAEDCRQALRHIDESGLLK